MPLELNIGFILNNVENYDEESHEWLDIECNGEYLVIYSQIVCIFSERGGKIEVPLKLCYDHFFVWKDSAYLIS